MVLGGVILKLEEFEAAASEKYGGSGKGGGGEGIGFFLHRKSILSCFGPQHSKKWWWWCWGGGGGVVSLFFSWKRQCRVMFLV